MCTIKALTVLLLIQLISHCSPPNYSLLDGQPRQKFFRKDYTFLEDSQAFYKIHTIHKTWQDAKKRCQMEGASLFYAEDEIEADAVQGLWNKTQPQFAWVYVGISDLLAKGVFETVDGRPVLDIYNNWGQGEPNDADGNEDCVILRRDNTLNDDKCDRKYPFICKKSLLYLDWNTLCDIPDPSYVFNKDLGKCYKFHLTPMNWTDAHAMCSIEQSYLAIINSQAEADYLVKVTEEAPKSKIKGNFLSGAVYLGYHNRDDDGWKTIKGTTLEESGYTGWGNQQPDGGVNEPCGSMFYNGRLNDLGCHQKCFFICEHDIGLLNSAVEERFGVME
ncbi:uncharacterized protein isoform X1 [Choristoneura fumiferana]|uniref:uncharacterized protein isoform X1 n=1 Tax=Choristoneura fumiferana TaxID=7141 RepID=UPI003D153861